MHYLTRYEERHPTIAESDEAAMINSYLPEQIALSVVHNHFKNRI